MTDSQEHILCTKSNPIAVSVLLVWTLQPRSRGAYLTKYMASNEIRIYVFILQTSLSLIMLLTVGRASCTIVLEYFTEGFVHSNTQYFKIFGLMSRVLVRSTPKLATYVFRPSH
jgi:hypothetical protein